MSRKNFSVLLTVCAVMFFLSLCSSAYASAITGELPDGKVGEEYNYELYYSGIYGNKTWSVSEGSLPPGLDFINSHTGLITGKPTQAGTYTFTILVRVRSYSMTETDSVTRDFTITILPNAEVRDPVISGTFPAGKTTVPYSESIYAADGRSPYTWSYSGNLPDGLALRQGSDSDIYTLSGTPTRNGTYTFTVTVTDSYSNTASKEMTVTIGDEEGEDGQNDDDDMTIGGTFPEGNVGTSYSESLYVNEGESPYTWSYTGPLPDGLYLSSYYSSYTLSGTPTTAGTYTFTVTVTDGNGKTASKEITITITGGSNGNNGNNNNTNSNTGGNTGNNTGNNNTGDNGSSNNTGGNNTGNNTNNNTNNNDNTDSNTTTNNNGGLNPNQNGGDGSQNVQINTGGSGGCNSGGLYSALLLTFSGLFFWRGKKEKI